MTIKSILAGTALVFALSTQAFAAKTDLTLGVALEPPHLDPTAGAAAAIDEIVYANIFEGLTRIGPNGTVEPALAESWSLSDDELVYTFNLHDGVTFHDGTSLDAGDVVFSLDRARAEDSTNAQKALFAAIDTVEAVDDLTVMVTLKQPSGSFLYNMGWGDAVIVAPETAETNKENPVGTGPFRFDSWAKGSSVSIVRNPDYWGDQVALEKAMFRFISDPAAATASLLAGDVQAFPNFPAPEAVPQFEADPRFAVVIGSTEGETILSTNNGKPPFDKLEVRQAIAHAIDRQAIIDGAMFGQGTPIGSHFAPHHPAYVELVETYPYDPERAKELLAEAGFPDGIKATIKLPPPSYARRGGEIVAAQLREVGIDLEIIPVEWAQWLDQVFKAKDYDLTIVSHTEPNDIGIYARDDYYFQYRNPEFNDVMAKLDATAGEEERYALMRQAQEILANDAVNGFMFQLAKTGIWDADIEGLWENSPVQANDLTEVRWTN
ncbi:ABC transporter substrate-binding protein [Oricola cellulosilytica]|uniref:ABC transporter substrate-binding protein n=2 Tax=Oricola cellulosilytica TaxID=1429082 RepID=A0A4R0PDB9_9HYPH|nr:ABC transporter substrate-binding protein [Oricola cellulosilytica]TCD15490.1 ABC transporter substrate-binding protein [Oricola cellulosilytica]